MSSKSYLSATYSGALCYWNLNKARCFPVPLTHKPMLWTLQLVWGNLHQGLVPDSRFTGIKLCCFGISTATGDETFTCWYILFPVVLDRCFIAPYNAVAFLPRSVHKCIDTRDKQEMDQRPPQTTAQLHTCCPSLSPVWRDRAEMQGWGWEEREEMALGCKIQFGCGKEWLAAYPSDCGTLHWETHPETGHSGCPVQSGCQIQGTDSCSVGPEEVQPAMPRGWKLQLLAGSIGRSSFQHGPRTSLNFQVK